MDESTSHGRSKGDIENASDGIGRWWVYLAVAVGGTWLFWLPAIALGLRFDSAVGLVLLLVGLAVPGVAGIAFVYLVYDERGRSDFWNRVVNPRRVGLRWLVVILQYPGYQRSRRPRGSPPRRSRAGVGRRRHRIRREPLAILPALFFATLPPILEELGWRGYALDRLQLKWSALSASLILQGRLGTLAPPTFLYPGVVPTRRGRVRDHGFLAVHGRDSRALVRVHVDLQ